MKRFSAFRRAADENLPVAELAKSSGRHTKSPEVLATSATAGTSLSAARLTLALCGLLMSLSAVGCGQPAPISSRVTVGLADRAAYEQTIANHLGKVVLVDCWATWCPPCVVQFPHTVQLSRKYDPNRLAVVSVSMDEPEDQEQVLQFLRAQEATFDNLISAYGIGTEGFEAFEITDGAIPHYKIYDHIGKLRHMSDSNEDLEQVIESLLNEE